MPSLAFLSYWLMRAMGSPLPEPRIPVLAAPLIFLALLLAGLGEEVGWSGYATDPAQERWGALGAAIALGLVWVVWHGIPLAQAHRAPAWIAWWALGTVGSRVLIVWLYNNTGKSVFGAALYHAMGPRTLQLRS